MTGGAAGASAQKRFSIARQLRNGFIALVVLLAAAAGAVAIGSARQYASINAVANQVQPVQEANVQARATFSATQAGASVYLLTGDSSFVTLYRQQRDLFRRWIGDLRRLAEPKYADNINLQLRSAEGWFKVADRAIQLKPGSPMAPRLVGEAGPTSVAFYAANDQLASNLAVRGRQLVSESRRSLATSLVFSGVLLFLAMGLALGSNLRTIRAITRPLLNLTATLEQLAAGEHSARAEVAGPLEIRAVARSVNTLADEGDRLRLVDQQHAQLRAMARDAGNRIRENLNLDAVIREAHTAIKERLACDYVYLHLVKEGEIAGPEYYQQDWAPPTGPETRVPAYIIRWAKDMARRHASLVIRDMTHLEEGLVFPRSLYEWLSDRGAVSGMVVPLATGSELLGIMSGWRTNPERPWNTAEIDAFESIAEDVSRGLRHARLYEAENRLVADLKALDKARSDFLATVSHELRTPLTSITGYVELLKERDAGPITAEQDQMLSTIHRNAALLRNLIENVLTISKIELGQSKTVARPVDLTETVDAAVRSMEPVAEASKVHLTSTVPPEPTMVKGDASQLDRVLMNLLSNAVKFTPRGGNVTVGLATADGFAIVKVADTGIGIPEKDKKELFSRFFRASNVLTRAVPGTGLGLSVSRTIITDHGGQLDLDSQEGVGTTAIVRLPLMSERETEESRREAGMPGEREAAQAGSAEMPRAGGGG